MKNKTIKRKFRTLTYKDEVWSLWQMDPVLPFPKREGMNNGGALLLPSCPFSRGSKFAAFTSEMSTLTKLFLFEFPIDSRKSSSEEKPVR